MLHVYVDLFLDLFVDCFCSSLLSLSLFSFFYQGKRKALKLIFANPPVKPTSRLSINPTPPSFQNPHMWVSDDCTTSTHTYTHNYPLTCFLVLVQRTSEDPQHRVFREAEDLSRATLWLYCWRSSRPGWNRPRSLWFGQQNGPQTYGSDHGCEGEAAAPPPPPPPELH